MIAGLRLGVGVLDRRFWDLVIARNELVGSETEERSLTSLRLMSSYVKVTFNDVMKYSSPVRRQR